MVHQCLLAQRLASPKCPSGLLKLTGADKFLAKSSGHYRGLSQRGQPVNAPDGCSLAPVLLP